MIDYLLVDRDHLNEICDFTSGNFNSFSDHAPLSFSFVKTNQKVITGHDDCHVRTYTKSVLWNDDNVQYIRKSLNENISQLEVTLDVSEYTLEDINNAVDNFGKKLNELILPYCDVRESGHIHEYNETAKDNYFRGKFSFNKPWFDETCKIKYKEYKIALHKFNKMKSAANHVSLIQKKAEYKKYSIRVKRKYKRQQGNMLSYIRNHNPKMFYKTFKTKNKNISSNITTSQFYEYFKNLIQGNSNEGETNDVLNTDAVFEELEKLHQMK